MMMNKEDIDKFKVGCTYFIATTAIYSSTDDWLSYEKVLCTRVFKDYIEVRMTDLDFSNNSYYKKVKPSEIKKYSPICVGDYTAELLWNAEIHVKKAQEYLKKEEDKLEEVKIFIRNRSFLWKLKDIIWVQNAYF